MGTVSTAQIKLHGMYINININISVIIPPYPCFFHDSVNLSSPPYSLPLIKLVQVIIASFFIFFLRKRNSWRSDVAISQLLSAFSSSSSSWRSLVFREEEDLICEIWIQRFMRLIIEVLKLIPTFPLRIELTDNVECHVVDLKHTRLAMQEQM